MKVALLIWNPQNRILLSDLLAHEGCEVLTPDEDLFTSEVDLFIVDGPALATSSAQLREAKKGAEPLFLPILLIGPRPDVTRTTTRQWELIDDIILRPILKRELQARIKTLLRSRKLSLRLRDALEAERRTNDELRKTRALYEREHVIAQRLQHAALPHTLPKVAGITFDAHYEASSDESQVGGDWYDAMCLDDGRVLISIGDVTGTGLEAAVTMASMRQAIRAVAQVYADPLTMLDAADRTLKEEHPGRVVTAFVGIVDPIAHTFTYASAGHPPPMLRTRNGNVMSLLAQSLPLGLRMRGDGCSAMTPIPPSCILIFYTDGLSEATRNPLDGERRLQNVLRETRFSSGVRLARAIKDAVVNDGSLSDDVAVLTMSVEERTGVDGVHRWHVATDDPETAARIRQEFIQRLTSAGAKPEALFSCELIFGELLGNVVRYAPGSAEIVLDMSGSRTVLHFLDNGRGFTLIPRLPTDLLSERGRGLFLIWTLSDDFNVDVRPRGGAHARAVLPVEFKRYSNAGAPAVAG